MPDQYSNGPPSHMTLNVILNQDNEKSRFQVSGFPMNTFRTKPMSIWELPPTLVLLTLCTRHIIVSNTQLGLHARFTCQISAVCSAFGFKLSCLKKRKALQKTS